MKWEFASDKVSLYNLMSLLKAQVLAYEKYMPGPHVKLSASAFSFILFIFEAIIIWV